MPCQQRCGARNEQVATAARERGSVRAMLRTQNMLQALLRSTRERAACFFQQSCLLPRLGSAVPFPCRSWPTTSPAAPSSWPRPLCAMRCAAPSAPRAAPLDARLALDAARHALRRARRAAPTSTRPLACAPTRTRDHTRPPPRPPMRPRATLQGAAADAAVLRHLGHQGRAGTARVVGRALGVALPRGRRVVVVGGAPSTRLCVYSHNSHNSNHGRMRIRYFTSRVTRRLGCTSAPRACPSCGSGGSAERACRP